VSAIGSTVTFDRQPLTIVGVTPPAFLGIEVGRRFDLILPIRLDGELDDRGTWLNILLRLKRGVPLEAAQSSLRAAQPQIRDGAQPKQFRETFLREPFVLEPAPAGTSMLRERFERALTALLAVAGMVLLIACANIANLLLARGTARAHEWSVRLALGASSWRLVRQLLAESALLAAAGTILGVVFARWATRLLVAQLDTPLKPVALDLSLDGRVLAFAAATMTAVAIAFGILPALRAARAAPIDALRDHGRAPGSGPRRGWSGGLVVVQVALSLLLVVAAGLFMRTFERLTRVPLGFDRDRVLLATISAPSVPGADRNVLYQQLVRAAASVPGVARAGGSLNPPIVGGLVGDIAVTEPGVTPAADAELVSQGTTITGGMLEAFGTPIVRGRDFDARDTLTSPKVIMVDEALVRRLFPGRDMLGAPVAMTFRTGTGGDVPLGTYTITGIVGDAAYRSLRAPMQPTIYMPITQRGDPLLFNYFYIGVRAAQGSPALLTRSVAAALAGVNRDLTMSFRPLSAFVDDSLAQDRLVAMLSGFFGALALLLAGLGLYGVTAYAVARRRTEIGIRIALGAPPSGVVRLVLRRVVLLAGAGIGVGVVCSLWLSTLIASLLYGLPPRDPPTLAGAAIVLGAIATIAGWLPAYRASRIDPAQVLREG
jgi:putative ABC transport system permease protein